MFVRKLKSKNSKVYIQVVDKSYGSYRVIKSFGGATSKTEEELLASKAERWINKHTGVTEFDFSGLDNTLESLVDSISSLKRVGYELLLGRIFDEIGFNGIQDDLFRELVIGRIAFPKSKLKTREYLFITARHKERLSLIDKGADASIFYSSKKITPPVWKILVLNLSVLLMGIGVGIFLAGVLHYNFNVDAEIAYPGTIFTLAGVGLFIGFTLSKKLD